MEGLKAQARANERSLEDEVRHLLIQRPDRGRIASFRKGTRRLAAATGGAARTDGVDLPRDDRAR